MAAIASISITPISNGFVAADSTTDIYGGAEWRIAESVFYANLDDLAADMPRFIKEAVEAAIERDRKFAEQLAAEQAGAAEANLSAQRQQINMAGSRGAIIGRRL